MMLWLLITILWTTPNRNGDVVCNSATTPATDIYYVEVWLEKFPAAPFLYVGVTTVPGRAEFLDLYPPSLGTWRCRVRAVDNSGNVGCMSSAVEFFFAPSVNVGEETPRDTTWYDIAGRKMKPHVPGVYFQRGGGTRVVRQEPAK